MIGYQLIEDTVAEGVDSYSTVIATFLKKEKALEEKKEWEKKEKEYVKQCEKCYHCPSIDKKSSELNKLREEYPTYCLKGYLYIDEYDGICCDEYYMRFYTNTYQIKTISIIE